MNNHADSCVILFVKYPVPGNVKTRLAKQVGELYAVEIYKCFVADMFDKFRDLNLCIKVFFAGTDKKDDFEQWFGNDIFCNLQSGKELGAKMKNAFEVIFSDSFTKALIIGTDIPDLPEEYIELAFNTLKNNDTVLGPSSDGGYYLIGFTKKNFLPEAFDNITWSSDKVLEQTISRLNKHDKMIYLLPQWHDVDTLDDLKSLVVRNKNTAFMNSHTISYLQNNKIGSSGNGEL